MTAPDPRVGEIQARSDDALLHESLNPSDYAELAWASARDVPYLIAELRDRDEVIARVEALAKDWDATYEIFPRSAAGILAKAHGNQLRAAVAAANGVGDRG